MPRASSQPASGLSARVAPRLLDWYDQHRRDLPWRAAPGVCADPYRVWLSEIMLQQTTVATVRGYYQRFLERWPTVRDLAAAPQEDVLAAWAGLGYYARARNLHACARLVAADRDGVFPQTAEGLRALPGIGPYTAGAIAAIAFDEPVAAVDGNVERVMARLFDHDGELPQARPALRALAAGCVPALRPGDYAQAVMDLGATVCLPRKPACSACPVTDLCQGRHRAASLPRKARSPEKPVRHGVVFWLARVTDGAILLQRRPEKGLLGGMNGLPGWQWRVNPAGKPVEPQEDWRHHAPLPLTGPVRWLGTIQHVFTHFRLELAVVGGCTTAESAPAGHFWIDPDDLDGQGLPTVMKKAVQAARAGETAARLL